MKQPGIVHEDSKLTQQAVGAVKHERLAIRCVKFSQVVLHVIQQIQVKTISAELSLRSAYPSKPRTFRFAMPSVEQFIQT